MNPTTHNNYKISYDYVGKPLELPDFYLHQVGRIIGNENTFYPNHYHNRFYELTIITNGRGAVYTNNKPVAVQKGDVYLSCPYDVHAVESDRDDPLQYDFCAFYPKDEKLKEDLANLSSLLTLEQSRLFHSNRISTLLPLAINEIQDQTKDFSQILLNSIFWQLSVYTLRILKKENIARNDIINNKNILCYQLMDYVTANAENIRALSELSEHFNYSYNYLSTVFKETTSLKLIDFYNMQRLKVAENLISQKNLTLEEIAEKTNFSSAFALSKAFKKRYGVSPQQYRKQENS